MMNNSPSFGADGLQFAWNAHSIKTAETCLRKYKYSILDGWTPRSRSVHLVFGGHYATALEHYHKLRADGADHEEALRSVVREALVNTWENGAPWKPDHQSKTRENLIRTIVWYLEEFKDDTAQCIRFANGNPAVELSFAFEVDDDIIFAGHIDQLVDYGGDTYVMDQKTTGGTIGPYFFDQFKPDTQMSMYSFVGKAVFQTPVKGVIIDGAQIAVGFTRFARGFTFRTDAELNEWYDNTLWHIERARNATTEQYFPMNTTACGNFGGCPFRHVCSRAPSVREQFLAADFVRGVGLDPLDQR